MTAILAGIASSFMIASEMSSTPNLLSILFFIPTPAKTGLAVISAICAVLILVRHVILKQRQNDICQKICYACVSVIFALACVDRIALSVASDFISASGASSQKGLNFLSTMFYIIRVNWKTFYVGILHTLELAFVGTIVGFILAILLVFCRIQKPDQRDSEAVQALKLIGNTFGSLYVTIIRGTPMMVQGLIVYYAGFRLVRSLFPGMSVSQLNQIYSVFLASAVTVSLNTAAYITEILRGSVEAIEKGQTEAARSLGLTPWQTMMKVIFPQAIRNSIPAICNEFIINIKDTSVLNAVGMTELMFMTTTVAGTYYVYLETYMITAVIYLILTIALQAVMNFFARRMDMPVSHGVPSSN
ncbi:MAG: amino acid ABC transporter permease [Bulleidia sp.]